MAQGTAISREEIDRLVRELGRKVEAPPVRAEPPGAPVRVPREFNMEDVRANRLDQIQDDYESALDQAEDAREALRNLVPYHPQRPVFENRLREAEARAERVGEDIRSVGERERARKGNVPPWVRQEIERTLNPQGFLAQAQAPRRAQALARKVPGGYVAEAERERAPGLMQEILRFAPVRYPLKAFQTLFRPISGPTPAAVQSLQQERPFGEEVAQRAQAAEGETGLGKTLRAGGQVVSERLGRALTAAQASADPLGRFSPTGARGKIGTYEPTTWQDVVETWFQGQQKPVAREQLEAMVARGEAPTFEDAAAKAWLEQKAKVPGTDVEIGRPASQVGGFAASLGLDPTVWLSAPRAAAGGGLRAMGATVVPESARAMPGALLSRIPGPVGRAGAKVSLEGLGKAVTWPARKVAEWEPWPGKTLGSAVKGLVFKYADLDKIADPYLREQVKQAFRLRDTAVSQQGVEWEVAVQRLLKGVPEEQRRLIRDIVEAPPETFDFGARGGGSFRGPEPDLPAVQRPPAPAQPPIGLASAPPWVRAGPGRRPPPGEKEVPGRATTQMGPIPGQGAVPPGTDIPPGAPRQGPFPTAPVHEVTPREAQVAGTVENWLEDWRRAIEARGGFRGSPSTALAKYDPEVAAVSAGRSMFPGRERYFPHERTAESLRLERGAEAGRAERLGIVAPEAGPVTDFGFLKKRREAAYVNRLIAEVNRGRAQGTAEVPGPLGAGKTLPGRAGFAQERPVEPVPDTISALNEFYRRPPKELLREFGGPVRAEAERFLDDAEATLIRASSRVTRGVNDYDLMARLRTTTDSRGRVVARPIVRVDPDGVPVEKMPTGVLAGNALEPALSTETRRVPGYRVPGNKAWQEAFPNVALPEEIARAVDEVGVPYWHRNLLDQVFVRPLHKFQSGWKTSATVARLGFGTRNYLSQSVMNLAAYGPRAADPRRIGMAHVLALPDWVFRKWPGLGQRTVDLGGQRLTVMDVRRLGQQAGLTRTLPRDVMFGVPTRGALEGAPHATRSLQGFIERHPSVPWGTAGAALGGALGGPPGIAAGAAAGTLLGSRVGRPFNPMSREFLLTKHVFAPIAEFSERQGRFLAFMLEMEERAAAAKDLRAAAKRAVARVFERRGQAPGRGPRVGMEEAERAAGEAEARARDLTGGAMRASEQQVDYSSFSPWFEKYATLVWPFAKWNVGMMQNAPGWALRRPGLAQAPEKVFETGEHLVPPWEREMVKREPESKLERETTARVVGYPGVGPLREPRTREAKGGLRLPYAVGSPFADVALNIFGGPARVLAAADRGKQLGSEALESALPAWKIPFELLTGRNLYTQEPVSLQRAVPAPRMVQALYEKDPDAARAMFKAMPVYDEERRLGYIGVPQWVSLFVRYFPNITTADLVASYFGGKRPYDNQTAITLRLFGLTHLLHDPELQATEEARSAREQVEKMKRDIESWNPPPGQKARKETRP